VTQGVHEIIILGEVRKITPSTPKDPKKAASAVILVQWGPQREQSGNQVEFINAGHVRIPNYRWPKLAEKMKVGQTVKITGHIQGVLKTVMGDQFVQSELVADRVHILDDTGAESADAAD
jgi:hypothetical protein